MPADGGDAASGRSATAAGSAGVLRLAGLGRTGRARRPGRRSAWRGTRADWGSLCIARASADLQLAPDRPEGFADVQFWVDTRDTRDISRATRFCHRFAASIRLRMPGRKLDVEVAQRPIARAVADPPMTRPGRSRPAPNSPATAGRSRSSCRPRPSTASTPRRIAGWGSPIRSPTTSARTSSWASAGISPSARTPASGRLSSFETEPCRQAKRHRSGRPRRIRGTKSPRRPSITRVIHTEGGRRGG